MDHDMELQWRPGANRYLSNALARLPLSGVPGADIDDSFLDDSSTRPLYRG